MICSIRAVGKTAFFLLITILLYTSFSLNAWGAGCITCGAIKGVVINDREGTTSVSPVVAGVDIGPGIPTSADIGHPVMEGDIHYYAVSSPPYIKWGASKLTFSGNAVLFDGIRRAGWTWASTSRTLTAPSGQQYVLKASGTIDSFTGVDGLNRTSFTYSSASPDRVTAVTDCFGNTWTYGIDSQSMGPTYAIDRDGGRKATFSYKGTGSNGVGLFDTVKVYNLNSNMEWVEQEHTNYTYDSSGRVIQVSTVDATGTSTTNITYSGNYLQRVENSLLKYDMTYDYSTTNSVQTPDGDNHTLGVVTIRRRSTYGQDTDSSDQVFRSYYYQDVNGKNAYLFRYVSRSYCGGVWSDYATTEYRIYGYNAYFAGDADKPSTDTEILKGQPWKVIDPRGKVTKYTYSLTNGSLSTTVLPTGDYKQNWYKQINGEDGACVEKSRDSRGKFTRYTYDNTFPSLVTQIEVSDNDATWSTIKSMSYWKLGMTGYNATKNGLLYQMTTPDIDGNDDKIITYDYEDIIDSVTHYRPRATTVSFSWYNADTFNYETKSVMKSYYNDNRLRWSKDALNNKTDYIYDAMYRLTNTCLPIDPSENGTVTSNTSTTITDSYKSWAKDQLKGFRIKISTTGYSPLNGAEYTIVGNTTDTVTVSPSIPTTITYFAYVLKTSIDSHYLDCCGLEDWILDPAGNKIYNTYDSARRLIEERNDLTGINSTHPLVQYTYNDHGQMIECRTFKNASDNTGRLTTYSYDQLGRLKRTSYPKDGVTALLFDEYNQYNNTGQVVAILKGFVDGNGDIAPGSVITAYQYDPLGRPIKTKFNFVTSAWPVAGGSVDSYGDINIVDEDVSYQYDGGSRLKLQMVDTTGISSYTYDAQGNLATFTPSQPSGYSVEYAYNANGDKKSVLVKSGSDNKLRTVYSYCKNGWLKEVKGQTYENSVWVDRTRSVFAYNPSGSRIERRSGTAQNDITSKYTYNARGDEMSVKHFDAFADEQYSMTYKRDGKANPCSVDFTGLNCPSVYKDKTVSYGYDAMGRLTSEEIGNGGETTYSFDWMGNRDAASDFNVVDEYVGGADRVYDLVGNLTHIPDDSVDDRTDYTYTSDNLLHAVTDVVGGVGTTTTMTWNADQQRVRLQREGEPRDWHFIYDPTASVPALLFSIESTYGDETFYVREPGGELLSSCANGWEIKNYHCDSIGNVVLISDDQGGINDYTAYDAWGNTVESNNSVAPFRFAGQLGYFSHEAGYVGEGLGNLTQLGIRFYDSVTGQFTQRDSVPSYWSAYMYTADNPLTWVDPWGLKPYTKKQCLDTYSKWISENRANNSACLKDVADAMKDCKDNCDVVFGIGATGAGIVCKAWSGMKAALTLLPLAGCYEGCVAASIVGVNGCTAELNKASAAATKWYDACMKTAQ